MRVPGAAAPADEGVPAAEEDPAAAGARAAGHRADRVRPGARRPPPPRPPPGRPPAAAPTLQGSAGHCRRRRAHAPGFRRPPPPRPTPRSPPVAAQVRPAHRHCHRCVVNSGCSGKPEPEPEFSGSSFSKLISGSIFGNPKYPKPELPDPKFSGNPNTQP